MSITEQVQTFSYSPQVHSPVLNTERREQAVAIEPTCRNRAWKFLPFALICFIGLLARIPFYLGFRPISSGDTPGYTIPYFVWAHHNFYLGERTPIYPLFLGLAQWLARVPPSPAPPLQAAYMAVCLQSLLDIVAACLLYYAFGVLRVRKSIGLFSALFVVTIPALCSFEMNLLNMSLSFFWLTLSAAVFALMIRKVEEGRDFIPASLITGFVLSCAGLLRSENLVFLAVLAAVMIGVFLQSMLPGRASDFRRRVGLAAILMLASAAPPVLAWMTWNYVGIGEFRITTLSGWNRSKTVFNMFDKVEPQDRLLGEVLTYSYRLRNRNGVVIRDHIWLVQDDLANRYSQMPIEDPTESISAFHQKVDRVFDDMLGMKSRVPCTSDPHHYCTAVLRRKINLGDYVGKVSSGLIRKYPGMYLHNVAENFVDDTFNFNYAQTTQAVDGFQVTSVGGSEPLKNAALANLTIKAVVAEAPLLTVLYVITLSMVLFSPLILTRAIYEDAIADITVIALASATVGTFMATCLLAGYNKEYSVPHLGVLVICTAYAIENWARIAAAIRLNRPMIPADAEAADARA